MPSPLFTRLAMGKPPFAPRKPLYNHQNSGIFPKPLTTNNTFNSDSLKTKNPVDAYEEAKQLQQDSIKELKPNFGSDQ